VHHTGGTLRTLEAKFELDVVGDVDGLNVVDGVGRACGAGAAGHRQPSLPQWGWHSE
jgi:hypothetical protein